MIRRPPRSTLSSSSAASDVYKRQVSTQSTGMSSLWRGFFVRKFKQKDLHRRIQHAREVRLYELQFQAVLVLQRAVRCMMAKNELKRRKDQRRFKFEASRGMSFEVVPIPLY
eukprot:TRINITY_DN3052_c0_g1_i6.p1 TRINITY_DN3052_c0_g1~~TRINITY_DN3052_c0_g1_i6.p1  ORF type:complete len:112 (-),score=14.17 TRINITY_DN3052_c0_g1_i6:168-503(-)